MLFLDVNVHDLIKGTSKKLESNEKILAPEWALYAKTGAHKQRPPTQDDWWTTRNAAILRSVALLGPIGTNKLRVKYGGKKNRGKKPSRFCIASGNVIRKSLQQLTAAGLIKEGQVKNHKGRIITKEGLAVLNSVAKELKAEAAKKAELEAAESKPASKAPAKKEKAASEKVEA